jgi:hypothetical protein
MPKKKQTAPNQRKAAAPAHLSPTARPSERGVHVYAKRLERVQAILQKLDRRFSRWALERLSDEDTRRLLAIARGSTTKALRSAQDAAAALRGVPKDFKLSRSRGALPPLEVGDRVTLISGVSLLGQEPGQEFMVREVFGKIYSLTLPGESKTCVLISRDVLRKVDA